jgi:hypothetical protein
MSGNNYLTTIIDVSFTSKMFNNTFQNRYTKLKCRLNNTEYQIDRTNNHLLIIDPFEHIASRIDQIFSVD